ncbi:TolB family protein [Pseudofulvibacter geojedonensis]|uniref:TolB family protein n=1 Tax=Pseudofulvibacter geojedonensis TaxID=1123758 RepID=A0ABW3I2L1_9FLAO
MKFLFSVLAIWVQLFAFSQEPALPNLKDFAKTRDFTISNNSNEAYFTVQSPNEEVSGIFKTVKKEGNWQSPVLVSFSGKYKDLEPFLSPDGLQLYFVSNRPLNESEENPKDYDIWVVERKSKTSNWSKPRNLGAPINTEYNEFYPVITNSKNMYFTSDKPTAKGKDDIFLSEWKDQSYQETISLSVAINSEGYEYNAFVAPDESFILFGAYKRKDGLGSGDMYISYKKEGKWTPAKNLGENYNSQQMDYCPFVHMPSKTLYFTSRRSTIKTGNNYSTTEFMSEINKYNNGLSRIYKIDFSKFIN